MVPSKVTRTSGGQGEIQARQSNKKWQWRQRPIKWCKTFDTRGYREMLQWPIAQSWNLYRLYSTRGKYYADGCYRYYCLWHTYLIYPTNSEGALSEKRKISKNGTSRIVFHRHLHPLLGKTPLQWMITIYRRLWKNAESFCSTVPRSWTLVLEIVFFQLV